LKYLSKSKSISNRVHQHLFDTSEFDKLLVLFILAPGSVSWWWLPWYLLMLGGLVFTGLVAWWLLADVRWRDPVLVAWFLLMLILQVLMLVLVYLPIVLLAWWYFSFDVLRCSGDVRMDVLRPWWWFFNFDIFHCIF
jgi:hypothetical protein